jgi:hypothetical protein
LRCIDTDRAAAHLGGAARRIPELYESVDVV